MLLYHFPLTKDLKTYGFSTLYKDSALTKPTDSLSTNTALLVDGGTISQKAKGQGSIIGNLYTKSISTFTVAFRFKADTSYTGITRFFELIINNTGTVRQIFLQRGGEGTIQVCYYNGSSYPVPYQITADNNWHNWVMIAINGALTFYIDNSYLGSLTSDFTTSDYMSLGANGFVASAATDGSLIQDVRIYDYAFSQAEINEYSRAMVVHYPLNGNVLNSNVIKDCSGLGNDLSYLIPNEYHYQQDTPRYMLSVHTTDTNCVNKMPTIPIFTKAFWVKYNGEWKHLAITSANVKYVDGVENADYDTIVATITSNGYDASDYRLYATALSASDIKDIYNAPIHLDNKHTLQCSEVVENATYPSKYWRIPAADEMSYTMNNRNNFSNLRTACRLEVSSGNYLRALLLLPDDWVSPTNITINITLTDYSLNTFTINNIKEIEDNGGIFFFFGYSRRTGSSIDSNNTTAWFWLGDPFQQANKGRDIYFYNNGFIIGVGDYVYCGEKVRLCHSSTDSHSFSTSATSKIKFAKSNLQYHCTLHKWRFAEHSYDYIGADNANISDSYNGWIDLFGYGTSGVNYSPTLHTTTNADYASGDIANTDNDWGVNEIQSYGYNVASNKLCKTGVVGNNEVSEGSANGLYANKLITNEIKEN